MLGDREPKQILSALVGKHHYVALFNMMKNYPDFMDNTRRYLTGRGEYPYDIKVRTPVGLIQPRLYTHHDILTVNEIFCRSDYYADKSLKTVVDLGSNIGISALYFLSRNKTSKCYLFEPDQKNITKLKANLSGFEDRYVLSEKAVSYESGQLEFGVEPTGRYGGIGVQTGETIIVECLEINDVLDDILTIEGSIDVLKIDTEGVEIKTVEAIDEGLAKRIKKIYLEARPNHALQPNVFDQRQYGTVCQLTNKNN